VNPLILAGMQVERWSLPWRDTDRQDGDRAVRLLTASQDEEHYAVAAARLPLRAAQYRIHQSGSLIPGACLTHIRWRSMSSRSRMADRDSTEDQRKGEATESELAGIPLGPAPATSSRSSSGIARSNRSRGRTPSPVRTAPNASA
jgi:hypothetical protein